MSAIPIFQIGIWNAWIFTAIFLFFFIGSQFVRDIGKRIHHGPEERRLSNLTALISVVLWIYSIFLPLKTGTAWFYTGLSIFILGMIVGVMALIGIVTTQPGKAFIKGMYRYSRHPLSLSAFLAFLGIGLVSASWVYLVLLVVLIVVTYLMVGVEEHSCIDKFGNDYREYMNRTPRWIGIPKS